MGDWRAETDMQRSFWEDGMNVLPTVQIRAHRRQPQLTWHVTEMVQKVQLCLNFHACTYAIHLAPRGLQILGQRTLQLNQR